MTFNFEMQWGRNEKVLYYMYIVTVHGTSCRKQFVKFALLLRWAQNVKVLFYIFICRYKSGGSFEV